MSNLRRVSAPAEQALPLLTERLRLRPLCHEDLDELCRVYTDPRVERFIGTHTREQVRAELDYEVHHQAEFGWALWGLEERSTGRFIGDCGLRPLEMRGPEIELGYDLHPDFWGRGLATEAAQAAIGLAFSRFAIDHVIAVVKADHVASRRVLEKCGLSQVGERMAYGELLLVYEILPPVAAAR